MPEPLPAVALAHQIAEVEREIGLRYGVYKKRVASGAMTPEDARAQLDRMRAVLRTLRSIETFDQAIIPVLSAMGYAIDVGETNEAAADETAGDAAAPPPSDGLEGSEPISADQEDELRALIAEHGWENDQVVELLAASGWRRLAEIPVRKLGLVRSALADAMHRERVAERIRARHGRAERERRSAQAA